jgi:HAD superfamily phosphatase (TIGR01668 family)
MPDLYLDDIYGITPAFLKEKGIRAVLLDIDNTLVTYDDPKPTPSVLAWLQTLKDNGIEAAFISNNHKDRVELFNEDLQYFATWDSRKPSGKCYRAAMKHFGTDTTNTAVIGDQVFTDVWSAKRLGLFAILVKPIKDKTNLFFKTKRLLEKPVLAAYRRRTAKKEKNK